MLGLFKRTNKEYFSAETEGSALEVFRQQVQASQLIRKYQMQSRVVFDISSQDWITVTQKEMKQALNTVQKRQENHNYHGKISKSNLTIKKKVKKRSDFKCIFHFQDTKIQYMRRMIAIIIAGTLQLLRTSEISVTLKRQDS